MKTNKVVWSEGLFLRPQIFQQQERYLEYFIHQRASAPGLYFWGFSRYEIDSEALTYGKLVLRSASGVFPDGTPFDLPGHAGIPAPLTLLPEHSGKTIFLAVPLRLDNSDETIFNTGTPDSLARFCAVDTELTDSNAIRQGRKPVQLARLRLQLLPESGITGSWMGLPCAKVKALRPDGSVLLHTDDYIPPVSGYGANALLSEWLNHLSGLVKMRAGLLAGRLIASDGKPEDNASVMDYLLLQIFNKYQVILEHLRHTPKTPPVDFYQVLAQLAAEASTFVKTKVRRPLPAPEYDHASLYTSIRPLVDQVHDLLNQILVRAGEIIPLHAKGNGIWVASVLPAELNAFEGIVLAVHARLAPDILQHQFFSRVKISAPQHLHELVRSHLPGLSIQALPVPPRQIPYRSDYVYFELQRKGDFWRAIAESGSMALHIAGDFPALNMELWGIRTS